MEVEIADLDENLLALAYFLRTFNQLETEDVEKIIKKLFSGEKKTLAQHLNFRNYLFGMLNERLSKLAIRTAVYADGVRASMFKSSVDRGEDA